MRVEAAPIAGATLPPVNRWRDWWGQAERDLRHAEHSLSAGDYEWAAFAAHQAAEKALKAVVLGASGEPWGHSVTHLLEALPASIDHERAISDAVRRLDKHYIPARYPNGFDAGFPGQLYIQGEAEQALADARDVQSFCRRHLPR